MTPPSPAEIPAVISGLTRFFQNIITMQWRHATMKVYLLIHYRILGNYFNVHGAARKSEHFYINSRFIYRHISYNSLQISIKIFIPLSADHHLKQLGVK